MRIHIIDYVFEFLNIRHKLHIQIIIFANKCTFMFQPFSNGADSNNFGDFGSGSFSGGLSPFDLL